MKKLTKEQMYLAASRQIGSARAEGFTLAQALAAGFTLAQALAAGFTLAQALAAGFTLAQARAEGFTLAQALAEGFTLAQALAEGFTLAQALAEGFTLAQARAEGFTLAQALAEGFTLAQALAEGFTLAQALAEGFTLAQALAEGFTLAQALAEGFTLAQARAEGFSKKEVDEFEKTIPLVDKPYTQILAGIRKRERLFNQSTWGPDQGSQHFNVCNSAMCTAGHLVSLGGAAGWALCKLFYFPTAAALIHYKAHPNLPPQNFGSIPDEWALAYIEYMAEVEAKA